MKQTLKVFILSLLLSLSIVSPALAKDSNPLVTPTRNRQKFSDLKLLPTVTQNKLELRRTKAQAIIKRLRQGLTSRFDSINKIKARIEARISKIEEANKTAAKTRDLTAAKAKLAEFNTDKYTTDLATFDAKVAEVLASSTPLKLTPDIKTAASALKDDLKSLRQILTDTLRLIIKAK